MSSLVAQRDHLATLKKETCLNASILSKIYPMPPQLANQIFKNDALEKPTQLFFIHLSYYFVCIIDPQKAALFTWPLYDSKSERTYRNEFSTFIADYCKLGVLSPVVSSYFVNPGCLKVTKLMSQLSELAVEQALQTKWNKDIKEVQEKFMSKGNDFFDYVEKETKKVRGRFVKHQLKKKMYEQPIQALINKIAENEEKVNSLKCKVVLQGLVDNFIKEQNLEGQAKAEIEAIKNIYQPAPILDSILQNHDNEISHMEAKWNDKVSPYLEMSQRCQLNAEALILRHTGQSDKKTYMIEYNPKTDDLETKDLEAQVNSQQKYILKNVIINERLNFPNLIRSFVISMCFILKNVEFDYDIQLFNECLEVNYRHYSEVLMAFRSVLERVSNAQSKLQASSSSSQMIHHGYDQSIIPPLPDLTDLKFNSMDSQIHFDSFTPLNLSKLQFNLRRKTSVPTFAKPQARSLITPFHQAPRDYFLQTMTSSRISSYERPKLNMSQNLSIISQGTNRENETMASGFTQAQIQRLLSTRKTSSSKKHKFNTKRNNTGMQRGGLFNESTESTHLFRSYSSPNLFEDREKRSVSRSRARKLSIMQEDSPCSQLEISGIALLESNSRCGTPQRINLESSRKLLDATSLPIIIISPVKALDKFNHILKETKDFSRLSRETSPQQLLQDNSKCSSTESLLISEESAETPKTALHPVRKTSSIEKIINRYKKVRANANIIQDIKEDSKIEIRTIPEEKENHFNAVNVDVFTATNRTLLPDLLSPSWSVLPSVSSSNNLEEQCLEMDNKDRRKPRESLGTALGVDHTFLDQFDLTD